MIGSFWNLCRTCPSMPVDKLHSEYRSTYRWHEYTGPRQEVVRRGPQSAPQAPPAPTATPAAARTTSNKLHAAKPAEEDTMDGPRMEPALPRRKKHPELAYRTHEFLALTEEKHDMPIGGSDDSLETTAKLERARSEERRGPRGRGPRRSQSEGPVTHWRLQWLGDEMPPPRRPRVLRSDSDPCEPQPDMVLGGDLGGGFSAAMNRISTEYRLQFAWPRGGGALMGAGAGRMLRPGVAAAVTAVTAAAKVVATDGPPRKSLSMGAIKPGNSSSGAGFISVHKKRCADCDRGDEGASELEPLVNDSIQHNMTSMVDGDDFHGEEKIQDEHLSKEDKPRRRREYKTEYKKKFRPFSQYDYVEGKFQKKREDMEAIHLPLNLTDIPHGDSWYREVLELRKKAGEYKHRGWGTELVPQHIADLYSKQMTLWEQVSRRSSLSALSLASTTPRCISKEEKDKENNKKTSPSKVFQPKGELLRGQDIDKKKGDRSESRSRKEFMTRHHLERTTGTTVDGALLPSPTREKLEPAVSRHRDNESVNKSPQKSSPKNSPRSAARSQSLGPAASYENRSPKRQSRAIDSTKSSSAGITSKSTSGVTTNGPTATTERRPRSNLDFQNKRKSHILKSDDGSPGPKITEDNVIVTENKNKEEDSSGVQRFADAIHEPVVKSPPEPTRVKSPEQLLMRSPEPVNWTVPLDTGKTFTVTQNVREGESCVNRPHSEAKPWTPPALPPPPAPQSAPPQLTDEATLPEETQPEFTMSGRISELTHQDETPDSIDVASPPSTRIVGTTLHCLDAPEKSMVQEPPTLSTVSTSSTPYRVLEAPEIDIASSGTGKSIASDVLEMARSRFDKLFGKTSTTPADEDEKV